MPPNPHPDRPFIASLARFAAYIFVGINTVSLTVFGSLIALLVVVGLMGAAMSDSGLPDQHLETLEHIWGDPASSNQLLVIPVNGMIVGDSDDQFSTGLSGAVNGYDIKAKLREAAGKPEVAGVLLEINSPGGTIYGSRAIADGVKYYRERTKQPVYAHIQGSGASGAYWAAASTDQIYADYGSDIGSIGVIMGPFKFYDQVVSESGGLFGGSVLTQKGIETVTITAGRSKDIGNPYRRLTGDEIRQLQQSINNEYDNFVQYVSQHRNIAADTIRSQIGAMIYDNKTAQSLKLIDGTGSQEDAYVKLAKAAQLDDYQVMREVAPASLLASLIGAVTGKPHLSAQAPLDTCRLTSVKLAYHGDVTSLCPAGNK